MKRCCKCSKVKEYIFFHKNKSTNDGYAYACKPCRQIETKNPIQKPHNHNSNSDLYTDIKKRYSRRMRRVLFRKTSLNKYDEILGCTCREFKQYIESQFTEKMNWDNYDKIWIVEHETPLRLFDLTKEEEVLKAFNYKNTRPFDKIENMKKLDRLPDGSLARYKNVQIQDDIFFAYNSI